MSPQLAMGREKPQVPICRRSEIVGRLFLVTQKEAIRRGTAPMVTEDLGIYRSTTYRIYACTKEMLANGKMDVTAHKARCGCKPKWNIPTL